MTDILQKLAAVELFGTFVDEELKVVSDLAEEARWQTGQEIYALGDPGGSMYVVLEGAVELFGIVGGIERLFLTVRAGGVFGLLTMLDQGTRPGYARALEDTLALVLRRRELDVLLADRPETGIKVLEGVGKVVGGRVRTLTEQFDATVAWNLEVTGLASLNLERLMSDQIRVSIELLRGEPLRGILIRFEKSVAGHEIYLQAPDGSIHVVPYHAVVRLSVDGQDLQTQDDQPTY